MKKVLLAVGMLVCVLVFGGNFLTRSTVTQAAQGQKKIRGYLYGVFEVEANKDLADKMIKAGFQVLSPTILNKIGLKEEIKTGYGYFYIPFQNTIVEVGQKKTRTTWNGSFTLRGMDFSPDEWSVKITTDGESITSSRLGFLKSNNVYRLYLYFSHEDMEKSMHFHFEEEGGGIGNSYKHVNNCTHCNLYPDCAIALAIGVRWCRDEHRYSLPQNDPRRFCNGEPKSYLNGDGYNCSYFFGWRQCR